MSSTPATSTHRPARKAARVRRCDVAAVWRCDGGGVELTPELRAVDAVEPPSRQYAGVGIIFTGDSRADIVAHLTDQRISPTHRTKALKRVYWRGASKPPHIDEDLLGEVCSS